MLEQIYNLFTGVRYAGVLSCNEKYDLGVSVIQFMSDGRCRAVHIEYRKSYDDEDDLRSLSSCFRVPFVPGQTNDSKLLHPLGWRWTLGAKRLTYAKAYKDYQESVYIDSRLRPNQKHRTLSI